MPMRKPGPGAGQRKPLKKKPGTKIVEVPYPTSNSGVTLKAQVSIPKAPWEEDDEDGEEKSE